VILTLARIGNLELGDSPTLFSNDPNGPKGLLGA
jgi:hypothetical protein